MFDVDAVVVNIDAVGCCRLFDDVGVVVDLHIVVVSIFVLCVVVAVVASVCFLLCCHCCRFCFVGCFVVVVS